MSKTDDMRALREARYAESRSRATKPVAAPRTPAKPATPATPAEGQARVSGAEASADLAQAGLCGHRAISGRTCTRDAGHAVKSHRYS